MTIDTPVPTGLENLLHEHRLFPPDPEFAAQATAQPDLYQRAKADRLAFWANQARELLEWDTPSPRCSTGRTHRWRGGTPTGGSTRA